MPMAGCGPTVSPHYTQQFRNLRSTTAFSYDCVEIAQAWSDEQKNSD
jgi:hypothetical protein